jgi:hypothetical protein
MTLLNAFAPQGGHDMLYDTEGDPRMKRPCGHDVATLATIYPAQAEFAASLLRAITTNLNPALPVLVSLVVMRAIFQTRRPTLMDNAGIRAVRLPLSIIGKRPDGAYQRYLTPALAMARQAWLTYNMAEKNRPLFKAACAEFGIDVVTTCCCSVKGEDVLQQSLVQQMDRFRSGVDRLSAPVLVVESLDGLPLNADIGPAEADLLSSIERALAACAEHTHSFNEGALDADFARLLEVTGNSDFQH